VVSAEITGLVRGRVRLAISGLPFVRACRLSVVSSVGPAILNVGIDLTYGCVVSEHRSDLFCLASARVGTSLVTSRLDHAARIRVGSDRRCHC